MAEQDKTIADYLQSIGVDYSVRLLGETNHDDWKCAEWRVTFARVHLDSRLPIRDKASLETAYYTGTGHRKAVKPQAASVLYSLLSDATDEPFDYWCDQYEYDQDSRKALVTYEECCDTRRQLNAFFTTEERAALVTMLEDY